MVDWKKITLLMSFSFLFLFVSVGESTEMFFADSVAVETAFYSEKPFTEKKENFAPSDTVYILISLSKLKPGKYELVTDWNDPQGELVRQIPRSFEIKKGQSKYKASFWFRMLKTGRMKLLLTGSRYSNKSYGTWKVHVHLNGATLIHQEFEISDW